MLLKISVLIFIRQKFNYKFTLTYSIFILTANASKNITAAFGQNAITGVTNNIPFPLWEMGHHCTTLSFKPIGGFNILLLYHNPDIFHLQWHMLLMPSRLLQKQFPVLRAALRIT